MGKQNMTLEDILNEYAPDTANKNNTAADTKKSDAQQGQTVHKPSVPKEPTIEELTDTQHYKDAFAQAAARRGDSNPPYSASRRPAMELNRTKVSFIQSTAMEGDSMPMRVNLPTGAKQTEQKPASPVISDTPKIRRMSDSTRAREIEKRKKRKNRTRSDDLTYTYDKERPEGEYLYTQIHGARKARHRKKVTRDSVDVTAVGTETIHLNTLDMVSMAKPEAPESPEPVDVPPAPRAEKTSIDLSDNGMQDAASLDISISRTPEEAAEEERRRELMTDKMELENVSDIRSDIEELHNAISFRILALTLVLLISGYLAVGEHFSVAWISELSSGMMAVLQLLLGFAAGVVCFPVLKNGFGRLLTLHADTDSLAAVALTGCAAASASSVFLPEAAALPHYMPCAVLALLLHTFGKMIIVSREKTNLRFAAGRSACYGLNIVENEHRAEAMTRGVLGDFPILATMRRTDSLLDFRKYTYSADLGDRFCRLVAPLCFALSLVLAILLTSLKAESIAYGLTLFSVLASACSCAAITFVVNLPLYKATRRMAKNGALMLGYQSVDDFYDTNSMMFDAASMFPDGSVKLAGVKVFSDIKIDETLLAAASLSRHAGSVFSSIFKEVLAGKEQKLYPVENFVYEDSMGLCGWINNQRVLLGNRELMVSHNIEGMPGRNKEAELLGSGKEAVYLSVSGNLSAMFLVELTADPQVKYWARHVARRGICMILHSVDAMITLHRISELFDIPQELVKIIPSKMYADYREETEHVKNMSASMACTGTFSSMAQLILGTKVIRHAATLGIIVQAVSILLGIAIVLMDVILHVGLTPAWMLALQCAAAVLTLICVNIRRIS